MAPPHEPTPSALAQKPQGILKNANSAQSGEAQQAAPRQNARHDGSQCVPADSLHWDESNLEEHEIEREHATRMVIDEPKTPFVHSASVPPVDDDNFSLGSSAGQGSGFAPAALGEKLQRVAHESDPVALNTRANASSHLVGAELTDAARERQTSVPEADEEPLRDQECASLLTAEAKHAEFSEKRHRHYGNEAQALKLAATLADPEEED